MKIFIIIFFLNSIKNWHSYGHLLTAMIAQEVLQEIDPEVISWTEGVLKPLKQFSKSKNHIFVESAVWADDLKLNAMMTFSPWHYKDNYFSYDGTEVPKERETV